ncbi:MAG: hypothetical protein Unbinned200contig1002_32 [Prokaryotic dsDNA virus sp.]|jgi:hypothetical protein|nr:MAG: hypothetical protein Unbinned200contig1002_32 [Prokaryotic dsDNA virus sp.]|tara:strand:- start:138 stop:341 length:204 start_codon:yes stop_codon:yes gene_type:complete
MYTDKDVLIKLLESKKRDFNLEDDNNTILASAIFDRGLSVAQDLIRSYFDNELFEDQETLKEFMNES